MPKMRVYLDFAIPPLRIIRSALATMVLQGAFLLWLSLFPAFACLPAMQAFGPCLWCRIVLL
jgi:hypothetical protein